MAEDRLPSEPHPLTIEQLRLLTKLCNSTEEFECVYDIIKRVLRLGVSNES